MPTTDAPKAASILHLRQCQSCGAKEEIRTPSTNTGSYTLVRLTTCCRCAEHLSIPGGWLVYAGGGSYGRFLTDYALPLCTRCTAAIQDDPSLLEIERRRHTLPSLPRLIIGDDGLDRLGADGLRT